MINNEVKTDKVFVNLAWGDGYEPIGVYDNALDALISASIHSTKYEGTAYVEMGDFPSTIEGWRQAIHKFQHEEVAK